MTVVLLLVVPVLVCVGYVVVGLSTGNDTPTTFGVGYVAWMAVSVLLQRRTWRRRSAAARSAIAGNTTSSSVHTTTGEQQ